MINGSDFYHVMTAMVPLYVAMVAAYGSVKWWKIFTPAQCSGINRFVALFAVPLLSFHFISTNNPYAMNLRFVAADTLQKLAALAVLFLWARLSTRGSLEWAITLFSLSTLPNTLVMGIPLLKGMYGDYSGSLMVQVVVLQCIVWYTLMLFLFEFRGARALISDQFPAGAAASIVSFRVDSDVISLDGREPLQADAEIAADGRLHVTVRKSTSSSRSAMTPRPSNLTGAEIYSLRSSRNPTPRGSSFNLDDAFPPPPPPPMFSPVSGKKDLHMFVWSSSASPVRDYDDYVREEFSFGNAAAPNDGPVLSKLGSSSTAELHPKGEAAAAAAVAGSMPPASVMTRLILIMVWRKLIRNPNTYSSLIGLTWSLVSFKWDVAMPAIIARSISILSDAGLGMAMFSLGLFMALQPKMIACGNSVALFSMGVRFLAGPASMALASIAIGLKGSLLHIAIVQAALPQGIVPFVFAKEYNVHPDILSTGVIFGMLVALPITLVYYILLGL